MDIRKADSKGRLTGFEPGKHYEATRYETRIVLEKVKGVFWDSLHPRRDREAVQEYLGGLGIDAGRVSYSAATPEGFGEYVLDEKNNRVVEYGAAITKRRPWPEGFDWDTFLGLVLDEAS